MGSIGRSFVAVGGETESTERETRHLDVSGRFMSRSHDEARRSKLRISRGKNRLALPKAFGELERDACQHIQPPEAFLSFV